MNDISGFEGYTLEWNDEFDQNNIDALNWVHEIGDGTAYGLPAGWGNLYAGGQSVLQPPWVPSLANKPGEQSRHAVVAEES